MTYTKLSHEYNIQINMSFKFFMYMTNVAKADNKLFK